jgi:hypothetical protein
MIEAIRQKAVIHGTEEVVAATDFDIESGEVGENKVFDATLEQMLTELPLDEKLLEELLDEDGLSASLNSVLLTQKCKFNTIEIRLVLTQCMGQITSSFNEFFER